MRPTENAFGLIRPWETFESYPYLCPAKVPTIGFGSTYYRDGTKVKLSDKPISLEAAESLMDFVATEMGNQIYELVEVILTQNQFDALVSFVYNVGISAFAGSRLLKKINAGLMDEAALEFPKWNKSKGKILGGLIKRRAQEMELFLENANSMAA
jgi:lysozyme